ncbi:MAG: Crp/Fnr family transcriptional regulator [Cyclobacterium sp.]|nr:Crp/Fnr family transcriptional regulator [Cyclobacterium sp.]
MELMHMENLIDLLLVDPSATYRQFPKGHILQYPGDVKARKYYVKKGLVRSYIIDSKGKEHIFMFAPEDWIIADIESLEYQKPSTLFIDCLEDSELIVFAKDILSQKNVSKEMVMRYTDRLYRRMGALQRRVLMMMSVPAIDRYNYFLETYPELPERIPQRMIATYLGITPQALSTLRTKMAQSKLS